MKSTPAAALTLVSMLLLAPAARAAEPKQEKAGCEAEAVAQAQKLLAFHTGGDERAAVEERAKKLSPLRNPVDKSQLFEVYEVAGHVYRANYRLRLIYYRSGADCLLMGQEVLELSRP